MWVIETWWHEEAISDIGTFLSVFSRIFISHYLLETWNCKSDSFISYFSIMDYDTAFHHAVSMRQFHLANLDKWKYSAIIPQVVRGEVIPAQLLFNGWTNGLAFRYFYCVASLWILMWVCWLFCWFVGHNFYEER